MGFKKGVMRIRQSKSMWVQEALAHKEVLPRATYLPEYLTRVLAT